MTDKDNLIQYYDEEAELRDQKTEKVEWKARAREAYCDLVLSEGKQTLLELGPGPGHDSAYFMRRGLAVTAVDISAEMVKRCRAKGIEAYALDYYHLDALHRVFDCAYALNTLLHVPKNALNQVLRTIAGAIQPKGLFYMGLYGGDDRESRHVIPEVSQAPRYFIFYSEQTLRDAVSECFEIISFETIPVNEGDLFHSIALRKA